MTTHLVHTCVLRPLLLGPIKREFFWGAVLLAGGVYTVTDWLALAFVIFIGLYVVSWWVTKTDPQMVSILWASRAQAPRYDAGKHQPVYLEIR